MLSRHDSRRQRNETGVACLVPVLRRHWSEIQPVDEVRSLAEGVLERHDLAAADAVQLAAALLWCDARPRRRALICFDERLARAGEREGFTVLPVPK